MVETYKRTLFIQNLAEATVKVIIYNDSKWNEGVEIIDKISYKRLTSWNIVTGEESEQLERYLGLEDEETDELHEYLILHFEDGSTATFNNSEVDMIIM